MAVVSAGRLGRAVPARWPRTARPNWRFRMSGDVAAELALLEDERYARRKARTSGKVVEELADLLADEHGLAVVNRWSQERWAVELGMPFARASNRAAARTRAAVMGREAQPKGPRPRAVTYRPAGGWERRR